MSDWIPIFRTGMHTDSQGNEKTWTKQDLDSMVAKYDPSQHEAPVVIGHPKDNAPAFGWVEGLKREGEILYARLKDLVPEFVEAVRKGLFKKRSISIYPDGTLRHIGWLGATPPAIKGLADVAFSDDGTTIDFIEFAATDAEKAAQQARSKKYGIAIRDDGNTTKPSEWASVPDEQWLDPVNYAYPCPDAGQTRAAASYWGRPGNKNKYSKEDQGQIDRRLTEMEHKFKIGGNAGKEKMMTNLYEGFKDLLKKSGIIVVDDQPKTFSEEEVKTLITAAAAETKKAMDKQAADFAEEQKKKDGELKAREDKIKADEEKQRKAGIVSFCEDLKKKGVLVPAMEKIGMGLQNFMEQISTISATVEFGEGDEKKKQTPLEFAQDFLGKLPKAIEFGEIAGADKDIGSSSDQGKRKKLVSDYQEKNTGCSYKDAILAVSKEHPDLFKREEG